MGYQLADGTHTNRYGKGDLFRVVATGDDYPVGSIVSLNEADGCGEYSSFKLVSAPSGDAEHLDDWEYLYWENLEAFDAATVAETTTVMQRLVQMEESLAEITRLLASPTVSVDKVVDLPALPALEPESEPEPPKQWHPSGNGFILYGWGEIDDVAGANDDYVNFGTRFSSREEAEEAVLDYRTWHRLYRLAKELNGDWRPNWAEETQVKFAVAYDFKADMFITQAVTTRCALGIVVFASHEAALEAIRLIKEENALKGSDA